eukprot:GGOE01061355.1.p1 GENE.GGOE01061355.1~~GGOE01061355.1.p1  ORF type:complete len:231 (-),score=4.56 GGOE01061355.1:98-790(-)
MLDRHQISQPNANFPRAQCLPQMLPRAYSLGALCIHLPAPLRSHVAFSTPAAPLSPSPTLCASTALLTLTRNCLAGTVSGIWVLWDALIRGYIVSPLPLVGGNDHIHHQCCFARRPLTCPPASPHFRDRFPSLFPQALPSRRWLSSPMGVPAQAPCTALRGTSFPFMRERLPDSGAATILHHTARRSCFISLAPDRSFRSEVVTQSGSPPMRRGEALLGPYPWRHIHCNI